MKPIASRIKNVIPSLINFDQTGFLKGRTIGENITLIESIINYTKLKDIPGLLLFVDFEKAFDTLEWSFIVKTLEYYIFGSSLISWIKTFYCNANSAILNNDGLLTIFLSPEVLDRGVHYLLIYLLLVLRFLGRPSEEIVQYMASIYLGSNVKSANTLTILHLYSTAAVPP